MQWIDSLNLDHIDNENIEEYTGLPFIKRGEKYEWRLEDVVFKSPRVLETLVLAFDLRYKGRVIVGEFQQYGLNNGYHLFQAIHRLLDVHLHTQYHPLSIPSSAFVVETINIFSPNRDILQLFLKGIRICSSIDISDEYNYTEENMVFHSNASE
jgi:hypothetical protein